MSYRLRFAIDPESVQILTPGGLERFEGVDFSPSGRTLGIATADANAVLLFRQNGGGRFEEAPYCRIVAVYPHDVAFSRRGDGEFLAVAQRAGAISIFAKNRKDETYGPEPVFEINGPDAKLDFSDGVAFVPPHDDYLAACNLTLETISFYRRLSLSPIRFEGVPDFQLKHRSVVKPDGLAFSPCGKWLAVANHGNDCVSVFRRRHRLLSRGRLRYGPEPVAVIQDGSLRYPHSVAFSPGTNHLLVTNAGANRLNVYRPTRHLAGRRWSRSPVAQIAPSAGDVFRTVNATNKMEGGPKGIAIHGSKLAVCCPEFGAKIYSFRETAGEPSSMAVVQS